MGKPLQANGMLAQNKTNLSGHQIGNYEMEELLISRVASSFYRGRDVKLDQPVFIEILHTTVEQDPDIAGSFQRRMEAVSQIKHRNIAPVIDISVTQDGYSYAIIEYIPGVWFDEQLSKWNSEEYIPPVEESLLLVRQIAEALSVAHPAGLVDSDLRPANILIRDSDNAPVLVDLGVPATVKPRDAVLTNGQSHSLDYTSPEEIEGKTIGRRSNIYSLGILLYKLLTGHRPRLPTSSWDIFERSTMPKEVPLEEERQGFSGETYRLVRNCLWRQEWSRFESADELISAIDTAILAEQSLPRTAIWSDKRRRWLYVAIPVVALLVLIFGLILVWNQFANAEQGSAAVDGENLTTVEGVSSGLAGSNGTLEPTETLTREAPPTSAAETTVSVFGPSAEQTYANDETIRFAWVWLTNLKDNEEFAVYLVSEDEEGAPILVGVATEPDNASLYLLESSVDDLDTPAGSYLWQVRLEDSRSGRMIVESDPRRLIIIQDSTPTPTEVPSTNISTATVTPTVVPATVTPTEVACVPAAPFRWLTHRVLPGENPSYYSEQANVPVQEIFTANCLPRDAILSVGQLLYIPPPLATITPTPGPTDTPQPVNGGGSEKPPGTRPTSTPAPRPTSTPGSGPA